MKSTSYLAVLGFSSALSCLMTAPAHAGGSVAISEFLNAAKGDDNGREFVELYNFGTEAVDLSGWTLSDEDNDQYPLDSLSIAAEDFLVLVLGSSSLGGDEKKALFEEEWLSGTIDPRVIGVDANWVLSNSSDEIQLMDDLGAPVWTLAYSDDETDGRATFLSDTTYGTSQFGSKDVPGVVREGDDNGTVGFLGYESNDSELAADPNAYESISGNVASPFFVLEGSVDPPLILTITGDCPGQSHLEVSGATPEARVAILYALAEGSVVIPPGNPCVGTVLGLNASTALYGSFVSDSLGNLAMDARLPLPACALRIQVLDVATCTTSNVHSFE